MNDRVSRRPVPGRLRAAGSGEGSGGDGAAVGLLQGLDQFLVQRDIIIVILLFGEVH